MFYVCFIFFPQVGRWNIMFLCYGNGPVVRDATANEGGRGSSSVVTFNKWGVKEAVHEWRAWHQLGCRGKLHRFRWTQLGKCGSKTCDNSSDYVNFLNEESRLSPGIKNEEGGRRDFVGCPVAKIPHSQCRGPGFSPRELDPTSVN